VLVELFMKGDARPALFSIQWLRGAHLLVQWTLQRLQLRNRSLARLMAISQFLANAVLITTYALMGRYSKRHVLVARYLIPRRTYVHQQDLLLAATILRQHPRL